MFSFSPFLFSEGPILPLLAGGRLLWRQTVSSLITAARNTRIVWIGLSWGSAFYEPWVISSDSSAQMVMTSKGNTWDIYSLLDKYQTGNAMRRRGRGGKGEQNKHHRCYCINILLCFYARSSPDQNIFSWAHGEVKVSVCSLNCSWQLPESSFHFAVIVSLPALLWKCRLIRPEIDLGS